MKEIKFEFVMSPIDHTDVREAYMFVDDKFITPFYDAKEVEREMKEIEKPNNRYVKNDESFIVTFVIKHPYIRNLEVNKG